MKTKEQKLLAETAASGFFVRSYGSLPVELAPIHSNGPRSTTMAQTVQ